ncbi:glycoside hydrolase domain-containing protein [Timonella sp. A28]|uniref:glycoside hydrolase domain-containing protein n=1 Tax=Timonella sp. A28 TaxID=3442640 RepID=UPI003EC00FAE
MADARVLETQRWLNSTYGTDARFNKVEENGRTGWPTINALTRALQIELGISTTADNFGAGTESRFVNRWPDGIEQQADGDTATSNVYAIIQGALWCKGYSTGSQITTNFYGGTGSAIQGLKVDMGFETPTSTVDVEIMKVLLSMKQFVLLTAYNGKLSIRDVQQQINRNYRAYTGIIPTDGLYGREMNKALIQVLQAIEGYTPAQATGNFGAGTRSRLKTINAANASTYPQWVWLGIVALMCNGHEGQSRDTWYSTLPVVIRKFQEDYAIAVTQQFDPTTWMSLLTSKGNPDRPAVACDTRFEITASRLATLKAEGYQIVGRYLTEPNQDTKLPEQYFKAIRPGELERITAGGMKFFPIFQENSRLLEDFTPQNGARHAREAREAAQRLGIPPTYIYFAVDMDILGGQIDAHIAPYFRAIYTNLGGGYKVGIYASRNVCTEIINAGLAGSAFVSDMSSGFSGNLGFPIPQAWNYDQFTEISNYKGQDWDLDKVAYSERVPAVSYVRPQSSGGPIVDQNIDYHKLAPIDLIWHLEQRFEELRTQGKVGQDYIPNPVSGIGTWVYVPTWKCIINYLAKDYLRDGGSKSSTLWAISAESFRTRDAQILEEDPTASQIITALDRYISSWRQPMLDPSGERIDLSHLCATTLGYTQDWSFIPNKWTGWAGDLATAMADINTVMEWNPTANITSVAEALVGQDENYRSHPGLAGLTVDKKINGKWVGIGNTCNRDDLCCDGDAIALAANLEAGDDTNAYLLSTTLRQYYNNPTQLANRFKQIGWDVGATNQTDAPNIFYSQMKGGVNDANRLFLAGNVSEDVINAACTALARYIF